MNAVTGCAAVTGEELTILANPVSWTTLPPFTACLASRHGGTWELHVCPAKDRTRWAWSVQYSGGGRAGRTGETSAAKFSMGQAEQAAADLDRRIDT